MKYLVTGGAGFIGSNLVDELINQGHEVVCVDWNGEGYWNENASNWIWDICDSEKMNIIMKDIDAVFHLAAEVKIQETMADPIKCYNTNVIGTSVVLEAARKHGVKNVVLSSTSAIYKCEWLIQPEGSAEDPSLNPYASSKKSAEDLCKLYSTCYGLNTTILRYFNVYGNRQHTEGQYSPVLGIFMRQKDENKPLTITGDGSQRRDFVHVSDVVNANILASQNFEKPGEIYNVGSGKNHSVQEIADMICPIQTYIDKRKGEIQSTQSIIDKIKSDLNWAPEVSLEEWLQNELKVIEV
tara:strand:- start:186 stop:1076 length:891 start_codon:yes stop_codon:yes gene_type:complete